MISSIWTEKYRPSTFDDIKGQTEIVEKMRAFVETKNIPHLLFSGPAGVGKCVSGDTPIVTAAGEIKSIKECFNESITEVITLNMQGKIMPTSIDYFYKGKADILLQVEAESGRYVKVTPEHPFLILKEGVPTWCKAEELTPRSLLATPLILHPQLSQPVLCWEKHSCFWAVLRDKISVSPALIYKGARHQVLSFLEKKVQATASEITSKIELKRTVVNWALASLCKQGVLIATEKKPKQYILKSPTMLTKTVPYSMITDFSLVEGIQWRGKFHSPFTVIRHLRALSPEFYEWLGMVYGDGHVRVSSIRFYNQNPYLRAKFKELSRQVFGSFLRFQEKKRKGTPYVEILRCRVVVALLEKFYNIPLRKPKAGVISVPPELFTAPDAHAAAFIRGHFECDGSFSNQVLEIASVSETMIEGLSYLLLRWGIHTRIKRRKNHVRLLSNSIDEIKRFQEKVNPVVKRVTQDRASNPNADVMTISKSHLSEVMKRLGIQQKELGVESFEHVFERGRAGRIRIQQLYNGVCDRARERIKAGLEAITLCEQAPAGIQAEISELLSNLNDSSFRAKVGSGSGIRSDRLKDYHEGKREPTCTNLIKMIKSMKQLRVSGAEELHTHVRQQFVLQEKMNEVLGLFSITYVEIAQRMNEHPANINYFMQEKGLSLLGVQKLNSVLLTIKNILEEKIFSSALLESLELLEYLAGAEIYWDRVKCISPLRGEEVYDLTIPETHNFIGGHGALILHNTTLSLVIAKQLFGESWRENTLELNASDERGIDIIRVKVKDFARTKAIGNVPFKICILDESDALTRDAQQALRRTMENYTNTCRFFLLANYSSKILDPIQSRCAIFRFKPLSEAEIYQVIDKVAREEGLTLSAETKKALFEVCDGDCRRLENIMQSCAVLHKEISPELVFSMASVAKPKEVNEVLSIAVKGNFLDARKKLLSLMLEYGLAGLDIIKQIQKEIWNLQIDDRKKVEMLDKCGEVEFRMVEGSDEFVQLESFLAYVVLVGMR